MSRMSYLPVLLAGLVVSACVGVRQEALHVYQGSTIPFTRKEVEGWRYDLISMDQVFSIRFMPGGHAPATIGSGKTLAAPGYRWDIDVDGRLLVLDDEGLRAVYQLLAMKPNSVILWDQTKGISSVFKRERLKP